jgi:hypothetical protein
LWRDRVFKLLLLLAVLGYLAYLAIELIIVFANQTNDPPLKTKIVAPPLGSGQPNFPAFALCHTDLDQNITITQISYATRGNATSGKVCQQYSNGTAFCDADFPSEVILWRVKISDPSLDKALGRRRRMVDFMDATERQQRRRRRLPGTSSPTANPTTSPTASVYYYSYNNPTTSGGGYQYQYGPPVSYPTAAYDPYAGDYAPQEGTLPGGATYAPFNEYEQPSNTNAAGVNCIAFNLTGLAGFTYKGHKFIRKEITFLFRIETTQVVQEPRIFDFGVDGLDAYYFSSADLLPGAAYHLSNPTKPTDFLHLDGANETPFVEKPSVFQTAYEDTNIIGVSLMTQLSFDRIETTTVDDPNPVVSYDIAAVSAKLDEDQIDTKFGALPGDSKSSHIGLIMTFVGPEVQQYMFTPPTVGALLGQLGGLGGLLKDFAILIVISVVVIDRVFDPYDRHNANKGKYKLPNGAIVTSLAANQQVKQE